MIAGILDWLKPTKNQAIEETHQSFLLENLPHIVFELDSDYRWSLLNKSWQLVTGFPREKCIGLAYDQFIHPEDRKYLQEYLQNLHLQQEHN